jgi:hypothetical protein
MPADGIIATGYTNTISGLRRKRGEMLANMADLRVLIAVLSAPRPRGIANGRQTNSVRKLANAPAS